MNAVEKQHLFEALEKNLWAWRGGALHAPNGTMWLDRNNPWNGDLGSFREHMKARAMRIQENLQGPAEHIEDVDASLTDVAGLVEVLDRLLGSPAPASP